MRVDWRSIALSLAVGTIGGLLVGSVMAALGNYNQSEIMATWFSAVGTIGAVVVSLITSRNAMKIAKYTGMYEERLNQQIQQLLVKVDTLITFDKIGPTAYPDYQYEPYHIPSLAPAVGEEANNMERVNRAIAFRRGLVADVLEIRQHLAAIRMLNNGHLDRETISNDIELVDKIVETFDKFEQDFRKEHTESNYFGHVGTYSWQRSTGKILQSVLEDFKLLRLYD
ncbi:hypothetical protein [Lacticaseibacillus jixiensis]|uniref:hypothetical protein n=1 Tax=Lacticaseibacillus jixiensis TaxID=3231926 RepID=UPI0036F1A6A9